MYYQAALGVAREMLEQWKEIYDARLAENSADTDRQYSVVSDPDSGEYSDQRTGGSGEYPDQRNEGSVEYPDQRNEGSGEYPDQRTGGN